MNFNRSVLQIAFLASFLTTAVSWATLPEGAFLGRSALIQGGDTLALLIKKDPKAKDSYYAILAEYTRVHANTLLAQITGESELPTSRKFAITNLLGEKLTLTIWTPRMYIYKVEKVVGLEYSLKPLMVTQTGEIDINTSLRSSSLILKTDGQMDGAELVNYDSRTQAPEAISFNGKKGISTWEGYVPARYWRTQNKVGKDYFKKNVNAELFSDMVAKFEVGDEQGGIEGEFSIAEKAPGMFVFSPQGNNFKGTEKITGRIGVFVDIVNWKSFGLEKFTTEELLLVNPNDPSDVGFFYERHDGYLDKPRPFYGDRGPSSIGEKVKEHCDKKYADIENKNPWTTWSSKDFVCAIIDLKGIREGLFEQNLYDPHVNYEGYEKINCAETNTSFRSANGSCTDISNASIGAAGTAFGRNVPAKFVDQNAAANLMNPNPSLVSKEFFTRDEFKPVPFLNMLAAAWIQFMNHDWLTHGKNMEANPFVIEGADGKTHYVERTQENANLVAQYKPGVGKLTANNVTHWWDGSQIYGSSQAEQNALRTFSLGKMRTEVVNGREVLPKGQLNVANNRQNQGVEMTGFKDNWWVGLSLLHTVFVKEHNAVAEMLLKKHVTYDSKNASYIWTNGKIVKKLNAKELDEQVFQTARLIVAAVMAKIHTVEWTPAILPNPTLKAAMRANWYGMVNPATWASDFVKKHPSLQKTIGLNGVDLGAILTGIVGGKNLNHGVPFSITEEFTSVYRLHSLLPETLEIRTLSDIHHPKSYAFDQTRSEKSYDMVTSIDSKDLFYSFGRQNPGQLVLNNFPEFMQKLEITGAPHPMDLGMVDIVRDRERGVPRYNQFRRALNMKPIKTYRDFFPAGETITAQRQAILDKFYKVYGKDALGNDNVEMIDLLVGTLAEEVRPKYFGFGETMFHIFIVMASRRLYADRFYTSNYNAEHYTQAGLDWIDKEGTMAQVIVRHMPQLKSKLQGVETAFNPWNE